MLLGTNVLKEKPNKDICKSNALTVVDGISNVSGSITANGLAMLRMA